MAPEDDPLPRDWTATNTALLDALGDDENSAAWRLLDARVRPILFSCCRRRGLSSDDAADIAQEAFVSFLRAYRAGQYDPARGRLRSFIVGIAHHRIVDHFRRHQRSADWRGESAIEHAASDAELENLWVEECRAHIVNCAFDRLRSESGLSEKKVRAFEEVSRRDRKPADVAAEFGMTPDEVHHAKFDCLKRMRGLVADLETIYAPLL